MRDVRAVSVRNTRLRSKAIPRVVVLGALFTIGVGLYGASAIWQSHAARLANSSYQTPIQPIAEDYQINVLGKNLISTSSGTFLRLQLSISNKSLVTIQLSPLLQMRVADTSGVVYNFVLNEKTTLKGGPIEAGQTVSGIADFAVTNKSPVTILYFRPTPDSPDQKINL